MEGHISCLENSSLVLKHTDLLLFLIKKYKYANGHAITP